MFLTFQMQQQNLQLLVVQLQLLFASHILYFLLEE